MYVGGQISCRFWDSSPITDVPADVARPRNSSNGSSVGHGRSGSETETRIARSRLTDVVFRPVSNVLALPMIQPLTIVESILPIVLKIKKPTPETLEWVSGSSQL